jgi:hypothetical protein
MALTKNRDWSQLFGDELAKKFAPQGEKWGGRCFRLSFKWVALTVAGEDFFKFRKWPFDKPESLLQTPEGYATKAVKMVVKAKWPGSGQQGPKEVNLVGGQDWEYDKDSPAPYLDLVRNPWKSGSKAHDYKKAVIRAKQAGPEGEDDKILLGRLRFAEFDVLKVWVARRNEKHQQKQLAVDGQPYGGHLANVLSSFNDSDPIGLLISGGQPHPSKETGFQGHAIAYYQKNRRERALLFNPEQGQFVEDNVGDATQPGVLKSTLGFDWPDYHSYRIRLLA